MYEQLILGSIQGITEWLPVSSEGLLILVRVNVLGSTNAIIELAEESLFLHLGTVLAAIVYFRSEVWNLLQTLASTSFWEKLLKFPVRFSDKSATTFGAMNAHERAVSFIGIATIISGLLGYALLRVFDKLAQDLSSYSSAVNGLVGLSLIATGILLIKAKQQGSRKRQDLNLTDTILLGIVQGLAAIPGLSRSGLTVAALLMKRFEKTTALRLSFIMSIPLVVGGNILLNIDRLAMTSNSLWGLFASFVFGLLTIHILLKIAQRVNFGYFVLGFGIITLLTALI